MTESTQEGEPQLLGSRTYRITLSGGSPPFFFALPLNAGTGGKWEVEHVPGGLGATDLGNFRRGTNPGALEFTGFEVTPQEHFGPTVRLVLKGPTGQTWANAEVTIQRG